jgi:hypothetical protein
VTAGAGLTGGTITTSGTIGIANGGVTNAMLANAAVTVSTGSGLTGGGTVALGGSLTLGLNPQAIRSQVLRGIAELGGVNGTRYLSLAGGTDTNGSPDLSSVALVPEGCTIRTFAVSTTDGTGPGAANTETFTVLSGATLSTLASAGTSCALGGTSGSCTSGTRVTIPAMAFVAVQVTTAAPLPPTHDVVVAIVCE